MTVPMNSNNNEADRAALEAERVARKAEIEAGGDLKDLPCPYCHRARFTRSDYIRCSHCGMNWPKRYNYGVSPAAAWKLKEEAEKRERTA